MRVVSVSCLPPWNAKIVVMSPRPRFSADNAPAAVDHAQQNQSFPTAIDDSIVLGANAGPSSATASPVDTAKAIRFNGGHFTSWTDALTKLTEVQKKAAFNSKWACIESVVAKDDSFTLRCKSCHKQCQLMNPQGRVGALRQGAHAQPDGGCSALVVLPPYVLCC